MRQLLMVLLLAMGTTLSQAKPRELVIFHTNDSHGHFVPEPAHWRADTALVGGFVALKTRLDSLRQKHPGSLYLDAGDAMTGNPICNIEYRGVKGGALLELFARCGVSASCLGNHEFDQGAEHLRHYVAAASHPILAANLKEKADGRAVTAASRVFAVNGLRVGVIGLLLDDLAGVVARTSLEPFVIEDAATTARVRIAELEAQTDVLVLLTHMGVEADSVLATRVTGVDVIVGGHSHTRLRQPRRVNDVLIVQAGEHLKNLGMLRLALDGDSVVSYSDTLIELVASDQRQTNSVAILCDSLEVAIQAQYGQVIGTLATPWERGYSSTSNVGNWICDRLRERYQTDVAVVNAGGIRRNINNGPVTMLDVMELLPFSNSVVVFEATGAELMKLATEQARGAALKTHGVLEMSGMDIAYDTGADSAALRLVDSSVNGSPVDITRTYRVASIDYVAVSQWAEYLGFEPRRLEPTADLLSDVISDEIRKAKGPIVADTKPRLREIP